MMLFKKWFIYFIFLDSSLLRFSLQYFNFSGWFYARNTMEHKLRFFSPIFNSLFIIVSVLKLVRQLVRRLILDQQFTKRTLWLNIKMSLIVVGAIPFLMEKKAKKSQFQLDAHGAITIEPTKKEFKGSESK